MNYVVPIPEIKFIPVVGTDSRFPVRKIYCVGRNFADHAIEMGGDPDREPPFFFTKPGTAIATNGEDVTYPTMTNNLSHEIELVVALSKEAHNISKEAAIDCVFGYAVGNELTRRDLQAEAKRTGRPWDTGKGFDCSALVSSVKPIEMTGEITDGQILLKINGELRQQGNLNQMIWKVNEVIAELSSLFVLKPGDLIYTGTPAGVGVINKGDVMEGYIEGVGTLTNRIV